MSEKHIVQCAKKLRDLHQAINKPMIKNPMVKRTSMHVLPKQFDQLSFPGGLGAGFKPIKKSQFKHTPYSIRIFIADPYFHRSGYIKEEILHYLKKFTFTDKQKTYFTICYIEAFTMTRNVFFVPMPSCFLMFQHKHNKLFTKDLLKNADAKFAQRLE